METIDKHKKIQQRIESIQTDLNCHYENIDRLKKCFQWHLHLKKNCHMPRVVKYSCIPRSESTYQFTLQNITSQISLLERELAVLIEYGI